MVVSDGFRPIVPAGWQRRETEVSPRAPAAVGRPRRGSRAGGGSLALCCASGGLRRALALLVTGEILGRLDVPEGRTCRCHFVPAGRLDAEPAPDDRDQRAGLHLTD